jgi:hypothetical protein
MLWDLARAAANLSGRHRELLLGSFPVSGSGAPRPHRITPGFVLPINARGATARGAARRRRASRLCPTQAGAGFVDEGELERPAAPIAAPPGTSGDAVGHERTARRGIYCNLHERATELGGEPDAVARRAGAYDVPAAELSCRLGSRARSAASSGEVGRPAVLAHLQGVQRPAKDLKKPLLWPVQLSMCRQGL